MIVKNLNNTICAHSVYFFDKIQFNEFSLFYDLIYKHIPCIQTQIFKTVEAFKTNTHLSIHRKEFI